MHNYDSVLKKYELLAKANKTFYYDTVEEDPQLAARFSRLAAAYEYAHVLLAAEMGVESPWADAVSAEIDTYEEEDEDETC